MRRKAYRCKRRIRIVLQCIIDELVDHKRCGRIEQHRVSVRVAIGYERRADICAGTRTIDHGDGLLEGILHMFREQACNRVGVSPGGERHHDLHRSSGKIRGCGCGWPGSQKCCKHRKYCLSSHYLFLPFSRALRVFSAFGVRRPARPLQCKLYSKLAVIVPVLASPTSAFLLAFRGRRSRLRRPHKPLPPAEDRQLSSPVFGNCGAARR